MGDFNNVSKIIQNLKAKPLLQRNVNYTIVSETWWLSCGSWYCSATLHMEKIFQRIYFYFSAMHKFVNSQTRVWGKSEEDSGCFLQCANQDQKILILPKSEVMVQQAPRTLQDRWYQHSENSAHFGTHSSWWLQLRSQACTKALFNGQHRKLGFCARNTTAWVWVGVSTQPCPDYLVGGKTHALEQQEAQYKAKQSLLLLFKITKEKC